MTGTNPLEEVVGIPWPKAKPMTRGAVDVGFVEVVLWDKEHKTVLNVPQMLLTGIFASVLTTTVIGTLQKWQLRNLYDALQNRINGLIVR